MPATVYFATNRRVEEMEGQPPRVTEDIVPDVDSIRFGRVRIPGKELFKKDLDPIIRKAKVEIARETLTPDPSQSVLGSREIYAEVREAMLQGRDALLFVHGYNYKFSEAVARAAQLQQWLSPVHGKEPVMMLFAWPSAGAGVGSATYKDDRRRAEASGAGMGRAILKAVDFIRETFARDPAAGPDRARRCKARIHLVAHSMGNWALRGAVQSMRPFVGEKIPPLFEEVLLIAADEDEDALGHDHKLAPILGACRRVTVYHNVQDAALKASDWAMGNADRLGRSGPLDPGSLPPNKVARVNVAPAILWDVKAKKDAWQEDDSGHQYYRNNPKVRTDILQVLGGTLDEDISGRLAREPGSWRVG